MHFFRNFSKYYFSADYIVNCPRNFLSNPPVMFLLMFGRIPTELVPRHLLEDLTPRVKFLQELLKKCAYDAFNISICKNFGRFYGWSFPRFFLGISSGAPLGMCTRIPSHIPTEISPQILPAATPRDFSSRKFFGISARKCSMISTRDNCINSITIVLRWSSYGKMKVFPGSSWKRAL